MVVRSPLLLNVVLQEAEDDSMLHISVESVIDEWVEQVPAEQYDLGYMTMPYLLVIIRAISASG